MAFKFFMKPYIEIGYENPGKRRGKRERGKKMQGRSLKALDCQGLLDKIKDLPPSQETWEI